MPSLARAVPLLVAVLVAALVGGCGSPGPSGPPANGSGAPSAPPSVSASPGATLAASEASSPTPSPTPSPEPTPTPAPTPTMAVAPLTGRLVREAAALRHPIAVMIDDLWAARPQSGLSQASVVWHAPAEAGIPRYMAIFAEGDPKAVGPIRSARYYYIGWAAEWKAVYAHVGGSPQALATLRSKGNGQLVYNADQFRWGTTYFWRIRTRYAPHNVYTDGKHLRSLAKKLGATAPPGKAIWRFAADAPLEARPVGGRIDVNYPHNKIRYRYDRTTNTYLRFVSGGKKDVDAAYKVQIAPKNVVVMVMRFGPLTGAGSGHGRLEARLIGSGTAWISTNGKTIKGTWKKSSMTGPTRFYDKHGTPVTLTVGQTYVQVIPPGTSVKFVAGKPVASPSPGSSGSPGASSSPEASASPASSPSPGS
jgi:Protein of unknown function (DUF3048) N-terminal domain/Protein of unknown function (DUF3048) C-terminal domain